MIEHLVAVDGPGGSGKSTVSRMVATRLGWRHLDTGAFYRAATVAVLDARVAPGDERSVLAVVSECTFDQADGVMLLDGRDVSEEIRSESVGDMVSAVSSHPTVRALLVEAQRRWVAARRTGAVVEGRDIGTVVFPDAPVKIYLTADPAERARRRAGETEVDAEAVAQALERRDRLDSTRTASPLRPADDALTIDTTDLGLDEVVEAVLGEVRRVIPNAGEGQPRATS